MKVVEDLTCKAIFYYSLSGNTKAIVEHSNTEGYDVYNLASVPLEEVDFEKYDTILIGSSTIGDGYPHRIFVKLRDKLIAMDNKRIGLFGSGNSIYEKYCAALDVLAQLLKRKNNIIFIYRFESYPTAKAFEEFQSLLDSH
ncbi:Flavodoxin [compost metagenome]